MLRIKLNIKGFSILELLFAVVIVIMISSIGAYIYHHESKHASATTMNSGQNISTAAAGTAPTIPTKSIYLGAWVNPAHTSLGQKGTPGGPGSNELDQLSAFDTELGRKLAILHVYTPFDQPVPVSSLNAIAANNAIPLLDWSCTNLSAINSGADDSFITAYAQTLKTYSKPVFLRWYWEMNLNNAGNRSCGGYANGSAYIAAWQKVRNIFQTVGANNVAFVWCPSVQSNAAQYYPGDKYVSWIAADGYDRQHQGTAAFSNIFGSFYAQWASHSKPLMIAETGAMSIDQAQYVQGIQHLLPTTYPQIKALVYFDSIGPAGSWVLSGSGFAAFKSMSESAYFSY
jgi:beta-mannanase